MGRIAAGGRDSGSVRSALQLGKLAVINLEQALFCPFSSLLLIDSLFASNWPAIRVSSKRPLRAELPVSLITNLRDLFISNLTFR